MQMVMFIYTRIGLHARSLNNPTFTEEQNNKILATSVGSLSLMKSFQIHLHILMSLLKKT